MNLEVGIERLAALVLLLTSLSHITAPATWAHLFERIRKSEAPGLANAAIHLPLGLLIVAFHPVWSGWGLLFTTIGWALLIKGSLHLLFPAVARRSLKLAGEDPGGRRYRLAGFIMLPLGLLLFSLAWS